MGAAYLCGVAGIANETVNNSAAYIQGWLSKLGNDKKVLVQRSPSPESGRLRSTGKRVKIDPRRFLALG
jgi:antirestriction protein ArdC